jgi:hypothetical protein
MHARWAEGITHQPIHEMRRDESTRDPTFNPPSPKQGSMRCIQSGHACHVVCIELDKAEPCAKKKLPYPFDRQTLRRYAPLRNHSGDVNAPELWRPNKCCIAADCSLRWMKLPNTTTRHRTLIFT